MPKTIRRIVCALVLMAAGAALQAAHAQTRQPTFDGTFRHIGFVVRDVEQAAKDYARLLGSDASPIHTVDRMVWPDDFQGDRKTAIKTTELRGHALEVHLLQPIGGASPWQDHLKQYGESLQHISFGVRDLKGAVTLLQGMGGRVTNGGADSFYAYLEFPQLPFTIELEKVQ